jgi:hypothetical protein
MQFDYWHIRRYFSLTQTEPDEVLPFGEPPIVLGNVVMLPEPVWKVIVATVLDGGAVDLFKNWKWDSPLPASSTRELLRALSATIANIATTGELRLPADLDRADWVDSDTALLALRTMQNLLTLATERTSAVETWTE